MRHFSPISMSFTRIYGYIVFTFIIILVIVVKCSDPEIKEVKKEKSTELLVVNETTDSVVVYLTLGADTNYVTNVNGIYGITTTGLQGFFILAPHDTVSYTSQPKGFSGNLSFNTPPLNCPTKQFPTGINIFEFALNNNFKSIKYAQETIDISCVAGVNSRIGCQIDSLGGWNAGNGIDKFTMFENSFIYDNVGRIGVYPYGCDSCSKIYQPPICSNLLKPSEPQKQNTCNIQRDANKKGGKVYVIYKGALNGEIN
jgi:hypothetical protein